jgi:hypothetical protein
MTRRKTYTRGGTGMTNGKSEPFKVAVTNPGSVPVSEGGLQLAGMRNASVPSKMPPNAAV